MLVKESNGLKFYEFESFQNQGAQVRFYTRQGGVSPEPWSSLNQGGTVGDNRENVIENRKKIFEDLNRPVDSIFDVWQVHGNNILYSDTPRKLTAEHQKADAIITDRTGITLFMRFADCVPIILFEATKKVISIVHAGWMGTVNGIAREAVSFMCDRFDIQPERIMAGIGPSIGPDHYQIGLDVKAQVLSRFDSQSSLLLTDNGQGTFLDLWKANEFMLREAGIREIERADICTACNTHEWYSHRQERGKTGRFAAVAYLE